MEEEPPYAIATVQSSVDSQQKENIDIEKE